MLVGTLLLKGDAAGALAESEKDTGDDDRIIGLAMAYHALGRKVDSDNALAASIACWGLLSATRSISAMRDS